MAGGNDYADDALRGVDTGIDSRVTSPRESAEMEAEEAAEAVDTTLDDAEIMAEIFDMQDELEDAGAENVLVIKEAGGIRVSLQVNANGWSKRISMTKKGLDGNWKLNLAGKIFEYDDNEAAAEDIALVEDGFKKVDFYARQERDPHTPQMPKRPFNADSLRLYIETGAKSAGSKSNRIVAETFNDWIDTDDEAGFAEAMNDLYEEFTGAQEKKAAREMQESLVWTDGQKEVITTVVENLNLLESKGSDEVQDDVDSMRAELTTLTTQPPSPKNWEAIQVLRDEVDGLMDAEGISAESSADVPPATNSDNAARTPSTSTSSSRALEATPASAPEAPKVKAEDTVLPPLNEEDVSSRDVDNTRRGTLDREESMESRTRRELDQLQQAYNRLHGSSEDVAQMLASMVPGASKEEITDLNFDVSPAGIAVLSFKVQGKDFGFSSGIAKNAVKRDFELDEGEYGRLMSELFRKIENPELNNVGSDRANKRLEKRMQKLSKRAERKLHKIKRKERRMDKAKRPGKRARKADHLQDDVDELQDFMEAYADEADNLDMSREEGRANAMLDQLDKVEDKTGDQ